MKLTLTEKQSKTLKFKINLQERFRITFDSRLGKKLYNAGLASFVRKGDEDAFGTVWRKDAFLISDLQAEALVKKFPELGEEEKIVINFRG